VCFVLVSLCLLAWAWIGQCHDIMHRMLHAVPAPWYGTLACRLSSAFCGSDPGGWIKGSGDAAPRGEAGGGGAGGCLHVTGCCARYAGLLLALTGHVRAAAHAMNMQGVSMWFFCPAHGHCIVQQG
jgi:hypothetical protein